MTIPHGKETTGKPVSSKTDTTTTTSVCASSITRACIMEPCDKDAQYRLEHDGAEPMQAELFAQRIGAAPTYTKDDPYNDVDNTYSELDQQFGNIELTNREREGSVADPMAVLEKWLIDSMDRLYAHTNEEGDTALHMAVVLDNIDDFSTILQHTYVQCYLDCQNHRGQTALHLAIAAGNLVAARTLVMCGASLTAQDRQGRTPLHIACQKADLDAVKVLTEPLSSYEMTMGDDMKYSVDKQPIPQNGYIKNFEGEPCLYTAAKTDNLEIVKHLVNCRHDINAQELKGGKTVLHLAVESENAGLVEYLLREPATDTSVEDYSGYRAVVLAHYHPAALQVVHQLQPKVKDSLRTEFLDLVNSDEDDARDDAMSVG